MTEGLYKGDCLDMMRAMEPESVDAIITDPPYGLSFMGKDWDHGVPGVEFWREALRVAKPGAHLCAFGGTRTYHRLACAIEDAGWEVRDSLALLWVQCAGFPKSLDVSKALDKEAGAEREVVGERTVTKDLARNGRVGDMHVLGEACAAQIDVTAPATDLAREWAGWGTALKPAYEPVIWARKRLTVVPQWRTMAQEVQRKVGAVLCLLLSDARSVEWLSRSNQSVCGEASDSALWIAAVLRGGEFVEWREAMATFSSPETVSTCLSIAWSWSEFLGDLSTPENMSTMSTETDPTTALRTLNSCLSALIPPCIIEAVCRLDGCESSAPGAESSSIGGAERTSSTPGDTAAALATLHRAVTSASTVVDSLRVAARVADSALRDATQRLGKQGRVGPATEYEPIILARKPLCGTVAQNVREHGTGALNIDACRIAPAAGDYDHPGNENRTEDRGHVFTDWARRGKQTEPHSNGRWPANLLLSHAPGCRKVGVRKVQGTHGWRCQRGDATATSFAMGGSGEEVGYADADGMETVETWECVEGCPIRALDEMSGVSKSSDRPRRNTADAHNKTASMGKTNADWVSGGHSDTGGASRFFTNFEPEVPFLYCPKASRAEREAGCDGLDSTELVCNNETVPLDEGERFIWEDAGLKQAILAGKGTSQARGIIGSLFGTRSDALADLLWHMCSSGRRPTGRFLQALCYTTATATSSTTDSPILSALQRWTTSECTQGANSETESGGRGVASAESSSRSGASAGTSPDRDGLCTDGADNATSPASFATSVLAKLEAESVRKPAHCTVKPLAVIEWLLKLATREGALVLDPFLGSGTTAVACIRLGRRWAGAEITEEYWPIIEARVSHAERTRQPELNFGGESA